ncbi:MAG TPA: histidine kinase [Trebonia sp.]
MVPRAGRAQAPDLSAGWARLVSLAVFAALVGVGLIPLRPDPAAAAVAAACSIAAGAVLLWRRGPLLLYATAAVAGVAVLGYNRTSDVGWFAVCLIAVWCGFAGRRRDAAVLLAGLIILFTVEWIWFDPDQDWGAWIGGTVLSTACGLLLRQQAGLVRQQADLVSQQAELVARLRVAQAGLAERTRAEERNRIGRELHDVIAHTLTVSLLHVTSARLAVEHDPADAARALDEAERLSRESLEEVRIAVGMLHSRGEADRTSPLPSAEGLPALVDRFRATGADITLNVDGDLGRLHAATGLTVYRIAQEALTNAVKHGPGAPATVTLTVGPGAVRLAVDSAGEPGTGSGIGMISMRERAESVGGSCQAGPGGRGWLVDATLPLTVSQRLGGAA